MKFSSKERKTYFISTLNTIIKQLSESNEEIYQYLVTTCQNQGIFTAQKSQQYSPVYPPDTSIIDMFFSEILPQRTISSAEEYEEEILKFSLLFQFETDILTRTEKKNRELEEKLKSLESNQNTNETEENIAIIQQLMDKLTSENLSMQQKIKSTSNRIKAL